MPLNFSTDVFVPAAVGLATLAIFGFSLFRVGPRTVAIVQRRGSFNREAGPGFHLKVPLLDRVVGRVNIRIQKLDLEVGVETGDGVGIKLFVTVGYSVLTKRAVDAFYKVDDVSRAITSCVFDLCKEVVHSLRHEDVTANTDEISATLNKVLTEKMEGFGYGIHKTLITNIELDPVGKVDVVESSERGEDLDALRDSARDEQRDAERDRVRDDARDFARDKERDEMRDAVRDQERDAERDA